MGPLRWSSNGDPWSRNKLDEKKGGAFVVATCFESEIGNEGSLYLERDGEGVIGRWDDTIVTGSTTAGGGLTRRDIETNEVISEGTGLPDRADGHGVCRG